MIAGDSNQSANFTFGIFIGAKFLQNHMHFKQLIFNVKKRSPIFIGLSVLGLFCIFIFNSTVASKQVSAGYVKTFDKGRLSSKVTPVRNLNSVSNPLQQNKGIERVENYTDSQKQLIENAKTLAKNKLNEASLNALEIDYQTEKRIQFRILPHREISICHRSLQNAPPVITSKCTTPDGGFVVDGGAVGKEGMRRRRLILPSGAERLSRMRWRWGGR